MDLILSLKKLFPFINWSFEKVIVGINAYINNYYIIGYSNLYNDYFISDLGLSTDKNWVMSNLIKSLINLNIY